jgi:hypothetical protein
MPTIVEYEAGVVPATIGKDIVVTSTEAVVEEFVAQESYNIVHQPAVVATDGTPAEYGSLESTLVTIPEDAYTPEEFRLALYQALGGDEGWFDVFLNNRTLVVEYWLPDANTASADRVCQMTVADAVLRRVMGFGGTGDGTKTLTGRFVASIGDYGGMRIVFPTQINLPSNAPFVMIQSQALGITTKTSSGLGFWRGLHNKPETNELVAQNSRTDAFYDDPKRLQEIDICLAFPNGERLDNRGSAINILIEIVTDDAVKRSTV